MAGIATLRMRLVVVGVLCAMTAIVRPQEVSEYRLPADFKPVSYRLDVITHLEDKFTFDGVVDIKASI